MSHDKPRTPDESTRDEASPHDEPAIRVEGLEFGFGGISGLFKGLSFEIPKGSICGLLGPNGCGKTTLIQLVFGILRRHAGQISVLGEDPEVQTIGLRRRVGFVPQVSDLDPTMTVGETFDFLRPIFGPRWNLEVEMEQCARFGLGLQQHTQVGGMSVGFKQRVSLVTALAIEPEMLLLDEPTAGLDAVVRREFAEAVVEFSSEPGRTVVLSSHLLGELERLIDHVVILRRGSSPIDCSLDQLKTRASCLVGRFDQLPRNLPEIPELLGARKVRDQLRLVLWAEGDALEKARGWLEEQGAEEIEIDEDSSLESRFVDLVSGAREGRL